MRIDLDLRSRVTCPNGNHVRCLLNIEKRRDRVRGTSLQYHLEGQSNRPDVAVKHHYTPAIQQYAADQEASSQSNSVQSANASSKRKKRKKQTLDQKFTPPNDNRELVATNTEYAISSKLKNKKKRNLQQRRKHENSELPTTLNVHKEAVRPEAVSAAKYKLDKQNSHQLNTRFATSLEQKNENQYNLQRRSTTKDKSVTHNVHRPAAVVSQTVNVSAANQTFDNQHSWNPHQPKRQNAPQPKHENGAESSQKTLLTDKVKKFKSTLNGHFTFICGICFNGKPPHVKIKHTKSDQCTGLDRHPWDSSQVMVYTATPKMPIMVRARPEYLGNYRKVGTCRKGEYCESRITCRYAHNPIEVKVWNLGPISYDAIVDPDGDHPTRILPVQKFVCSYCDKTFSQRWQVENHTNTPEHQDNVRYDKERPWRYRETPGNVTDGKYKLCTSVKVTGGHCPFSNLIPADNPCPKAHSTEELEEWNERHQYRQMKIRKARQHHMFSFMNQLQAEYGAEDFEVDVISEAVPNGVTIKCDQDEFTQYINQKQNGVYTLTWNFSVECSFEKPQLRVGLLHDAYRLHFHLTNPPNLAEPQVCPGSEIYRQKPNGSSEYKIGVTFMSRMLGRFKQWVIFDFGPMVRPVVKREFIIHVGLKPQQSVDKAICKEAKWDSTNAKVIPCECDVPRDYVMAAESYRTSDFQVDLEEGMLRTETNYEQMMHHLLTEEERTQQDKLSQFSMETTMAVSSTINIPPSQLYAQDGKLFGIIDISESTLGDTDASQIALSSVEYILVKFDPLSTEVYEARIVTDGADGRTRDAIYVYLAARCVQALALAPEVKLQVQIQFRLNRMHLLTMHWAVHDFITSGERSGLLFPSRNQHPALICPQDSDPEESLNRWQEGAVRFITEKGGPDCKTPLLLLYGPFGTGKTYTLANGMMNALRHTDSRILICTHNNSAADLYITEYLDDFVQSWSGPFNMKMLRVSSTYRNINTLPEKVRRYLLLEPLGNIRPVTETDVRGCRIVVTTTMTAAEIASFHGLRGYFTHILIDEAAQVLETEAIIPLILATPSTCVVLAGDHIQTGPQVYSEVARKLLFHHSFLERLFDYCLRRKCHRQILLTMNYRTHQDILTFLSKMFYSAEDMEACGNQPKHPQFYPLEFRAVKGNDEMVGNSYVNHYEISETADRIEEILDKWPESWGPRNPSEIGVLTPYRLQVQQLRVELRRRKMHRVFVDRLQGVQGKQFRVVILNTVRTPSTIKLGDKSDTGYYLGFLSDRRQLNTAFTRAQSLVVVVGNPVSLCSIGECCTVWKKYIKECEQNQSLYPQGTAYADIRLDMSTALANLNPDAMSFVPSGLPIGSSSQTDKDTPEDDGDENSASDGQEESDEEETVVNIDDVILIELCRQIRKDRQRINGEDVESSDDDDESVDLEQLSKDVSFSMVDEEDGHVSFVSSNAVQLQRDAQDAQDAQEMIHCIFRMDLDGSCYAIPVAGGTETIHIGSYSKRGRAMDGDEVFVQILPNDDAQSTDDVPKTYGMVVSVEKRAENFTGRKIVCMPDPFSDNLMVPVNRRLPKIVFIIPGGKAKKYKTTPGRLTVPICSLPNLTLKREIIVNNRDRSSRLFMVKWLRWNEGFDYPLGVVVDDLPSGDNELQGLKILRGIHDVPDKDHSGKIPPQYQRDWTIPKDEYSRRRDLRDLTAITIDSPDTQDIDDALSVERLPNGEFQVGIHIADVAYFVKPGSEIDTAARKMATSFYPAFSSAIHMLPTRLSTDLCSLRVGCERLAISLFVNFNQNGVEIPNSISLERSIICVKAQLTYADAQKIIDKREMSTDPAVNTSIACLSRLTWKLRKVRMGKARFSYYDGTVESITYPQANTLVEEMMLLANMHIAQYLLAKIPQCTPIRRQLSPAMDEFDQWKNRNEQYIHQSPFLTHKAATIQGNGQMGEDQEQRANMGTTSVLNEVWRELIKLCTHQASSFHSIAGVLCSDQYHPQFAAIHSALSRILPRSEYLNSGTLTSEQRRHCSLSVNAYTHFTSPIRRYIDLVVHRCVVAVLSRKALPHEPEEISIICHHCNVRCAAAREFETQTHALQLAIQLKQEPLSLRAVVERVQEKEIQIGFKHDARTAKALKQTSVPFNLLKPIVRPEVSDIDRRIDLKWKERSYHTSGTRMLTAHDTRASQYRDSTLHISVNHRFSVEIASPHWQSIMDSVDIENPRHVKELLREAEQLPEFNVPVQDRRAEAHVDGRIISVEDVSCETNNPEHKLRHYVEFYHTFETGGIASVQLHSGIKRGLLTPVVQLFKMTPTLDFCFEHRNQPIECFSEYAEHIPNRRDIMTYQNTWLPIIEMTSAYNAVEENETAVIHGIKIEWQYNQGLSLPTGSFTLKKTFCDDRQIRFGQTKDNAEKTAFLCIRYWSRDDNVECSTTSKAGNHLEANCLKTNPHALKTPTTNKCRETNSTAAIFVAHATTLDVKELYNKKYPAKATLTVFFEVTQMSGKFPPNLRKSGRKPSECVVEVIPVLYPDSRLKIAITGLDTSSSLVKNICLMTPCTQYDNDIDGYDMAILAREGRQRAVYNVAIPGCSLNPLNRPQGDAIRYALTQQFTVIQGPPGTGKTMTGAYLVYFFTEQNKHLPNRGTGRPQILYCGPSNKSVDVIAEYLKNFSQMSIVRVYSNEIETREFPIPGFPRMAGKMGAKDTAMDPRHRSISLHHLIRMRSRGDGLEVNSKCDAIHAYDRRFRTPRYEPDKKEVKAYHKLVSKAEIEELCKYQVILTTCNAAGSNRIIEGTNIKQCIVDEAGMCNEPETLIPLVATKPLEVVLIGDHKQLRPIIKEPTARLLGMEVSLLQRYAEQMNMLTIQYRMHEEICKFPSTAFYDGRLVTPPIVQRRLPLLPFHIWPSGGSHPMVFCHCTGNEETLSVRTAEGNEMSKANVQEVEQVVRMTRVLIDVHKIKAKDIVVLSQYRLQCDKISTALAAHGKGDVDVRTVVKSQGSEWNIVILSTVRSLPRVEIEENPNSGWRKKFLGFIADENQMNVALTRAKHGLIIVGNKYLLGTHKRWRQLLEHYEDHNCMANAHSFLR